MAASLTVTTTDRLKKYFGGTAFASAWDDWWTNKIAAISKAAEEALGRWLKAEARTVYADIDRGQTKVLLKGYPISAVASVYSDPARNFGSGTDVDSSLYTFGNGDEGILSFDYELPSGPKALKITYTGGMAADTAALATDFADLVDAIDQQLLYAFKTKDSIGFSSVSGGMVAGGGEKITPSFVTYFREFGDMLPELRATIKRYRSWEVERW